MAGGGPVRGVDRDLLNRRAFLFVALGTAVGASLLDRRAQTLAWESIIRPGFPLDDRSIWQLGSNCANVLDNCTTFRELVRHLRPCPGVTWVAGGARSSLGQRRVLDRLARLIADEFAAGETLVADGWVLSHTEAALCAAASIRARQARA